MISVGKEREEMFLIIKGSACTFVTTIEGLPSEIITVKLEVHSFLLYIAYKTFIQSEEVVCGFRRAIVITRSCELGEMRVLLSLKFIL